MSNIFLHHNDNTTRLPDDEVPQRVSYWCFSTEGNIADIIEPYLIIPTTRSVFAGLGEAVIRTVSLETVEDWTWYMFSCLGLDPLTIVTDDQPVDHYGYHRFGYVRLNSIAKRLEFVSTYNPKGTLSSDALSRICPFQLFRDYDLDGYPKKLQMSRPGEDTTYDPIEARVEWDELVDDIGENSVDGSLPKRSRLCRVRAVDLKASRAWVKEQSAHVSLANVGMRSSWKELVLGPHLTEIQSQHPELMADLLFYPEIILTQDEFKDFTVERARMISEKNWVELKHHFSQLKKWLENRYFGKTRPLEIFVSAHRSLYYPKGAGPLS